MVVAKVLGLVGWAWYLDLVPLWLPAVTCVVAIILANLGRNEFDPEECPPIPSMLIPVLILDCTGAYIRRADMPRSGCRDL